MAKKDLIPHYLQDECKNLVRQKDTYTQEEIDKVASALNAIINTMRPGNLPELEDLDELQAIFDETGATERINLVEECSRKKAEEMGMTMEEYTKYTFEHCSRGHFNNEEGAI